MKPSSSLWLYACLVPKFVRLCWRHRISPSSLVYSNPLLPYGGLSFCEKHKIFEHFLPDVLPYVLLRRGDKNRFDLAKSFADRHGLPLVLKPNLAHAGIGVALVESTNALEAALHKPAWDSLLQAYDDSACEFSFFYHRFPSERTGKVLSITEKVIPMLVGDGRSSLRQLLKQSDYRNKKTLQMELGTKKSMVPSSGEAVPIGVVASHSRGGIFTDKSNRIDKNFTELADRLCNKKGFYFGRLDVKAKSIEALLKGQYRIIEVNGACAEFIQFWDDKYTFKELVLGYSNQFDLLFRTARQSIDELKRNQQPVPKGLSTVGLGLRYLRMFWVVRGWGRR